MANKIQVKRGVEANIPILDVGEPAFTTDTKKLFIGTDTGNMELATKEQINSLDAQLADKANQIDLTFKADKTYVDNQISSMQSGVKGTYINLTALQTAFPTGDTGNYVLQSDGHIYNWNGTTWVDTGIQYQSTGIAEGSITPDKTTFISRGKNCFTGHYQKLAILMEEGTGILREIIAYENGRMAVIPIDENETYTVTTFSEHNRKIMLLANNTPKNGGSIEHVVFNDNADNNPVTFTNTNYKYLLVYVSNTGQEPPLQVEVGSESTSYEEYRLKLDNSFKLDVDVDVEEINGVKVSKNKFNGQYSNIYINNNIENPFINTTPNTRTAIIEIGEGKYSVLVEGEFNRFVVAFSDSLSLSTVTYPQTFKTSGVKPQESITVNNTEGYKYLLVYVSNSAQNPNVYVFEGETPTKSERIFIHDNEIAKKEDIPNIAELNIKRYQSYYESELLDSGSPTMHTDIYSSYDSLVTNYTDYVSVETLGTNAEGNELRSYKFSRPSINNYTNVKKPKIGIIAGLHGAERSPVVGTLKFLSDLCENKENNQVLNMLKSYVDIYVIPVANPTGYDNNTRQNGNMVDLNRNFPTNWVYIDPATSPRNYSGESPNSELETQFITDWLHSNKFNHVIDYHNTGDTVNYGFSWMVATGDHTDELTRRYTRAISLLSTLWTNRYTVISKDLSFGYVTSNNLASVQSEGVTSGAKSITLEVTWHIMELDENWCGTYSNTFAADLLGNYLLEILKEFM